MSFFLWLAGTKAGRVTATIFGLTVSAAFVALRAYLKGRADQRAKQDRASLENLRNRAKLDDEVRTLSPDRKRERLGRWVRDE